MYQSDEPRFMQSLLFEYFKLNNKLPDKAFLDQASETFKSLVKEVHIEGQFIWMPVESSPISKGVYYVWVDSYAFPLYYCKEANEWYYLNSKRVASDLEFDWWSPPAFEPPPVNRSPARHQPKKSGCSNCGK